MPCPRPAYPLVAFLCLGLSLTSSCSSAPGGDAYGGVPEDAPEVSDTGNLPTADAEPPTETDVDPAPPAALTYPDGPFGLAVGQTFPNLELQGYRDARGEWTKLSMLDHYDPDGARGVTGIYLVLAAQWCGPCNMEAHVLSRYFVNDYRDRGAHFVTAVVQDAAHRAATQATVDEWIATHKIVFDIASDPTQSAAPKGTYGLPYNYVINPRTMKVVRIIPGVDAAIVACGATTSCSDGYTCSPTLETCLPNGALGPIYGLDAVMIKNGAPKFDTGIGE